MFRLGSTSYVYPGDLLHNAKRLLGRVQDIELILFESASGESNIPPPVIVRRLADLAAGSDLSYTVHLPLDLRAAEGETHPSLRQAERVIHLTAPLRPYAYVFHLDGGGLGQPDWATRGIQAIESLLPLVETPAQLALENLESYDPEHLLPVFDALPISRTLDVGHLWKMERDPLPILDSWLPFTRVVHLHGLNATDHQSLAVMPPEQLDPVIKRLVGWPGVLTLEVFETDFFSSQRALLAALKRVRS